VGYQFTKEIQELYREGEYTPWGLRLRRLESSNIKQPKAIIDAMEKEIAAEREQKALILKAEGEHKVAELNAESEKLLIEKTAEATGKVIRNLKNLMPDISDEKIVEF